MRIPIRAPRPSGAGIIRARSLPRCSRRRCRWRGASCRPRVSRAAPSTWNFSTTRPAAVSPCSSSIPGCRRSSATCTGWSTASTRMRSPSRWRWARTCGRCRRRRRQQPLQPAWCGAASGARARRRRQTGGGGPPWPMRFRTRRWLPIRWRSRCSRAMRAGSTATAMAWSIWVRRMPRRWRRARHRCRRCWAGRMRRMRRMQRMLV